MSAYRWTRILGNQRIARWTHPGATSLPDGRIAVSDPATNGLLFVDRQGTITGRMTVPVSDVHDLAWDATSTGEQLWIVDPGFSLEVRGGRVVNRQGEGQVVAVDLEGRRIRTILAPPLPIYTIHEAGFRPTSVAIFGRTHGGNGDVWVADGYGTSLIHRFDSDGNPIATLSGEEGRAGAFRNPHALLFRVRRGSPELVIADRHNSRIQFYDAEGRFKRALTDSHLITPSALAFRDGRLYVAELQGGIEVFDDDDRHIESILPQTTARPTGWPNVEVDGRVDRPKLAPGRLNSPHGIAVDGDGALYVAEWVQGGRISRLAPATRRADG